MTEPWTSDLVCALLRASGQRVVLETGGFVGHTSEKLGRALLASAGGTLLVAEIDRERAVQIERRLARAFPPSDTPNFQWHVHNDDVMHVIAAQPDKSLGLVFVDDDHRKDHVAAEIEALLPKTSPGGLLVFHDVLGAYDLQEVVRRAGGYVLDLPRFSPGGGLGILQVPTDVIRIKLTPEQQDAIRGATGATAEVLELTVEELEGLGPIPE